MNGLLFFFYCFLLFVNVPEPGEAHTTESTYPPPLRPLAWERYRPHNSPRCLRTGVWHVCFDHTAAAVVVQLGVKSLELRHRTDASKQLSLRWPAYFPSLGSLAASTAGARQSKCCCSELLLCSIDNNTIPKRNTLSPDTRTYLRGGQHSLHSHLRENSAVSWVWGVCGDDTLLLSTTRRVAELRNPHSTASSFHTTTLRSPP